MKLRVRANSIRLRLTQQEVSVLAEGGSVREITRFSLIESFEYILTPWHLAVVEAKMEVNVITVYVPGEQAKAWAESDEEGIYGEQENGSDLPLKIAIEKDFACVKPRTDEDESDNFPHPNSGNLKC